jgi:hypothetical protein
MFVTDSVRPDLGGNMRCGDARTFMPRVWRYLVERFAVSSMLDVGCGEGHTVKFFSRLGVIAHGIDGLRTNVERAVFPIALHDLLRGPYCMPVDLVWSCEVAEHILPEKVDHFVDTLANGTIIAMTHGLPGQSGHHHVNCQPSDYWIDKLRQRNYVFHPEFSGFVRDVAGREDTPNHFTASGLVFQRA